MQMALTVQFHQNTRSVSGHRLLRLVSDSETYVNAALNCACNEVVWINRLAPPPRPQDTLRTVSADEFQFPENEYWT
jgi:hypothetical protein